MMAGQQQHDFPEHMIPAPDTVVPHAEPAPVLLSDYAPPAFLIPHIRLDFTLDPAETRVVSHLRVLRAEDTPPDAPLHLDGEALTLVSVKLDGRTLGPAEYALAPNSLTLHGLPDAFDLEIETICRPEKNTALSGLYLSGGRFCTQCEAEGFRRITYFMDRPDVLAVYEVRMSADKAQYPSLLANGNLVESGDLPEGRHYAIWRDPFPKPAYLFALVAGGFDLLEDQFVTMSGRKIPLRIYVDPGESGRAVYAMDSLKRAMRWDEKAFGREYDLDLFMIVAVRDFNFGAMENKGLNVFNSSLLLADPQTATDADYEAIESVVAHEYFHNWTGNRITCRDWFQLCLKEGLTVFRDQEFSADQHSRPIQRIKDVRALRRAQFPEDSGPLAHPVRPESYMKIDNFYTRTVYEKGAEIVRMMRETLGAEAFRAGMDRYFADCDGMAATVEDFIAALEKGSGRDLSAFMRWYRQAGTPRLTVDSHYDQAAQTLDLTLRQATPPTPGQAEKAPVPVPVRAGLLGQDGGALEMRLEGENAPGPEERLLLLTEAEQSWRFTGVPERPVVSALRGFTAPVILEQAHDERGATLMSRTDPDLFNRWEAGQRLMRDLLADASRDGTKPDADLVAEIWRTQLTDLSLDPAFAALALTPPSEAEIAQLLTPWDPEAVHTAREALLRGAAERLRSELEETVQRLEEKGPGAVDAQSMGRRALKNVALLTLARLGAGAAEDFAWRQFEQASTMTDVLAAIAALDVSDSFKIEKALDAFYEKWKARPLVLDKWFSIQAGSPRPETLAQVRRLTGHGRFDAANPNRVRSLIGAFAMNNPARFHAPGGGGYELLAEWVLTIDRTNPALAARLLGAMESWRRLEPGRRVLAESALRRVRDGAASGNVIEISSRALATP